MTENTKTLSAAQTRGEATRLVKRGSSDEATTTLRGGVMKRRSENCSPIPKKQSTENVVRWAADCGKVGRITNASQHDLYGGLRLLWMR